MSGGSSGDLIEEYVGFEKARLLVPDDIVAINFGGVVVEIVMGDLGGDGGADLI